MSDSSVPQAQKIVAGAAHGAWMVVLIGAIIIGLGWVCMVLMRTFAEGVMTTLMGEPITAIWPLVLRQMANLKLLLSGWLMLAIFLSYWWRALKASA